MKRLLFLTIFLSGCGTITIRNREVCGDLGAAGAHCANTLIDKKRDVPKAVWDKERVGMLCMSSAAYTDAETAIDQFCTAYNVCTYEIREDLRRTFYRIYTVVKRARAAKVRADVDNR